MVSKDPSGLICNEQNQPSSSVVLLTSQCICLVFLPLGTGLPGTLPRSGYLHTPSNSASNLPRRQAGHGTEDVSDLSVLCSHRRTSEMAPFQ